MIRLYSTLHRATVDLVTRDTGRVGMYVCGDTVQSEPHVGHGRSAVAFDAIRRYLMWRGLEVTFVRNVTDIDDKIIVKAAEAGRELSDYAEEMTRRFSDGYRRLGVLEPDVKPRATDHIPEMHELIAVLIDRGLAYRAGDDVYFSVRADEDYGKLSRRSLDEVRGGTRVEANEAKHDALDFALWKGAKPGEPAWESPWGPGRPGWHIECSAMARRYLGEDFDLHAGGADLIFPHHENEIAQSESATGRPFARYWVHNGMVNLDGAKMAKSTGNIVALESALDTHGGMALRLLFLRAHYRAPIDYSADLVAEASEAYRRIERLLGRAPDAGATPDPAVLERFREAMDDDFGTPAAVGVLFDAIRDANRALDAGEDAGALVAAVGEIVSVLGLDGEVPVLGVDLGGLAALAAEFEIDAQADPGATIDLLLDARQAARAQKDFAAADSIRDRLTQVGVVVEDTPDGARWIRG